MKILIWEDDTDTWKIDASTPEKEASAFKFVFLYMEQQEYYFEVESGDNKSYEKAKQGDIQAMKRFVMSRSNKGYEYERVHLEELSDPDELLKKMM